MTGSEMTLARYYAKQAVKAEWKRQGLKPHHIVASQLNRAADAYLDQHREELIALATERYRSFVESGRLPRPRNRRKASQ
jgi:hypothetical protein